MGPPGPTAQGITEATYGRPNAFTWRVQPGVPPFWWGWGGWGVVQRPIPRVKTGGATGKGRALGVGWGPPDLTLPLVEMAEMERPVMEVTVTDSRMMIQVRTVEEGGDVITIKLSQGISRVRWNVGNLSQLTGSPCQLSHLPALSLGFLICTMGLCPPPGIS